jgi:hypothetical protein
VLCWPDVTEPSRAGTRQVAVPSFEGATVLFGGVRRGGSAGVGGTVPSNDTGLPAQLSHNVGDGRTTWVGGTASGYGFKVVSEGSVAGIRL